MADKVDDLMIKTLNKVSETGNITTGDIFVLKYCKHERAKQSQSPAYKLYTASGAVAFTPSTAGIVVVALYKDGNLLPCSVRTMNVNNGVLYMLDAIAPAFEGEACRVIHPEITVQISGVDGSVSRVCLNVTRLA